MENPNKLVGQLRIEALEVKQEAMRSSQRTTDKEFITARV